MFKTKSSKVSKQRGTNSHGWGHKKKHRGAGHRGGKGLAGTGARGDSRKSAILSKAKSVINTIAAQKGVKASQIKRIGNKYFGKFGFTALNKKSAKTLSLSYIEDNYDMMVEAKMIEKDVFDSTKYKIDKIIGRSKFTKKLTIICNEISANAKLQIESAGGKVKVLKAEISDDSSEE